MSYMLEHYEPERKIARLEAEIDRLRAETAELRGAMQAADERMLKAGERVGLIFGCDTPAAMADEISRLRSDLAAAKQVISNIVESEVEPNRADAERYRWLIRWLQQHGLLIRQFCQPSAFEKVANWWVLKEPALIKGDSRVGYGDTQEKTINAAMRNHSEPVQNDPAGE